MFTEGQITNDWWVNVYVFDKIFAWLLFPWNHILRPCGGGGATLLYNPYRYVPPQRVGFLGRFGLKTGIHFAHFGLESGMVFEGTTVVHERIDRSNSKWVRKKEKYAN